MEIHFQSNNSTDLILDFQPEDIWLGSGCRRRVEPRVVLGKHIDRNTSNDPVTFNKITKWETTVPTTRSLCIVF